MSSWSRGTVVKKKNTVADGPFHTRYHTIPYVKMVDKAAVLGRYHESIRMFNCAIVAKDLSGNPSFVIKDCSDTLLFIYRVTPLNVIINSIYLTKMDIDTYDVDLPVTPVIRNQKKGDKEDARFFIYRGRLGLSYTNKYTMGIAFLTDDNSLEEIPLPFAEVSSIEKNWTFFEHNGELLAIRFYRPFIIYKIDIQGRTIEPYKRWEWEIPKLKHSVRGGAPPVLLGDRYYIFTHTSETYQTQLLTIHAETLMPLEFTPVPLLEAIYSKFQFICGAVFDERKYEWVLSMGLDDLYCAVVTISHTQVLRALVPITDLYEIARITNSDDRPSVGPASTSLEEVAAAQDGAVDETLEIVSSCINQIVDNLEVECDLVVSEIDQTAFA